MVKAVILSVAIVGIWLAVGTVRAPAATVAATGFTANAGAAGARHARPVIQV